MSFVLNYGGNGVWYGSFSSLPEDVVVQAVTARFGGVSAGDFTSLNAAMHNGDAVENAIENRRILAGALHLAADRFVTAEQVHGDAVYRVTEKDAGRGAYSYGDAIAETDGLITDVPGIALLMFFADCVPVLFVDSVRKAIGLCHAGWRGTAAKIASKTVRAMRDAFGSRPEDLRAAIAPSIGPCCYEVDGVVEKKIRAAFGDGADGLLQPRGGGKWLLDLWQANAVSLREAGVLPEHIEVSRVCTCCNASVFYSYRAQQGKTGRIAVVLCLKKNGLSAAL